ncbi:MAG: hypothetical protein MJK04_36330 [Psychrosphaera sp.]|nr:hypothetical protein [Psychrosphaera sp.]
MAIEHSDVLTVLTELNCRSNYKINKIAEYMLPELKEPFYLQHEGRYPQIIIRPAFEVFLAEFTAIKGVNAKDNYYHSAQMTRFPTRKNKGNTEVHYVMAFSFDGAKAIRAFIHKLISIVKPAG